MCDVKMKSEETTLANIQHSKFNIPNSALPLMEHYYTIQGEGYWTGTPAYFIRLGGCDVGCAWCDVKESWDADAHSKIEIDEIVSHVTKTPAKIVVITGGEPLMYNLDELTNALKKKRIRTHLETSGAYPFSGNFDWVCFSPKKFKAPHESIYAHANELKIIVVNKHDLIWAEQFVEKCPRECKLFFQPEWETPSVLNLILDYIKENPKWRVSLQTHKYMNIP